MATGDITDFEPGSSTLATWGPAQMCVRANCTIFVPAFRDATAQLPDSGEWMIRRPFFRLASQHLSIAILHAPSHRMCLPRSFDQGSGATAVACLVDDINGGLSPSSDNHGHDRITAGSGTGISHTTTPLFQIVSEAGTNGLSLEFHPLAYKKFSRFLVLRDESLADNTPSGKTPVLLPVLLGLHPYCRTHAAATIPVAMANE